MNNLAIKCSYMHDAILVMCGCNIQILEVFSFRRRTCWHTQHTLMEQVRIQLGLDSPCLLMKLSRGYFWTLCTIGSWITYWAKLLQHTTANEQIMLVSFEPSAKAFVLPLTVCNSQTIKTQLRKQRWWDRESDRDGEKVWVREREGVGKGGGRKKMGMWNSKKPYQLIILV